MGEAREPMLPTPGKSRTLVGCLYTQCLSVLT